MLRRSIFLLLLTALAFVACANASSPAGDGGTQTTPPPGPSRVDLVEAGLREVLPKALDGTLFIRSELCTTGMADESGKESCGVPLSADEQADLLARLGDVSADIRFVASYEDIPKGEAPIDHPGAEFAWVGDPAVQPDGTYHMEAGETCGGLCGHGGTFVMAERDGTWRSIGPVPGSGMWIS